MYDNLDSGRLVTSWLQILQEGASVGVRVVLTGDRSLLVGRVSTLLPDKLMLRMTDRGDYSNVGLGRHSLPDVIPAGRAFRADGSTETQIALLASDPVGTAQVAALETIREQTTARWADLPLFARPPRVDILPSSFDISKTGTLMPIPIKDTELPVAVGGDTLCLRTLDALEHGPALLITGTRRTGRSTALKTMAFYALAKGWNVVIITPKVSPLRDLAPSNRVQHYQADVKEETIKTALAKIRGKKRRSIVLVDDVDTVRPDTRLSAALDEHANAISDTGSVIAAAGVSADLASTWGGIIGVMRKAGSGFILAPKSNTEALVFGARLQPSEYSITFPPGGGFLVRAGEVERAQILFPDAMPSLDTFSRSESMLV